VEQQPLGADRAEAVGSLLHHHDRSQLLFQLSEIVGRRSYLQHGIDVGEGDVVLDVGANVGVSAVFFAAECGAAVVHSFEPVRPIYDLLRRNVRPFPSCTPHAYGLSSSSRQASITYYPGADAMSGLHANPDRDREMVRLALVNRGLTEEEADSALEGRHDDPLEMSCELRTLSSVLREEAIAQVDLLKIDVERAELEVIEGVGETDWPRIRQLAVEVHDEDGRCAAIAGALADRGFTVTTDQDPTMRRTDVRMLYAARA